jgi:hypothetical protein
MCLNLVLAIEDPSYISAWEVSSVQERRTCCILYLIIVEDVFVALPHSFRKLGVFRVKDLVSLCVDLLLLFGEVSL